MLLQVIIKKRKIVYDAGLSILLQTDTQNTKIWLPSSFIKRSQNKDLIIISIPSDFDVVCIENKSGKETEYRISARRAINLFRSYNY